MTGLSIKVLLAAAIVCFPFHAHAGGQIVQNEPDTVWTRHYHDNIVTDVIFSPDGSLVASTGHDLKINITNASTGELVQTIATPSRQIKIAFGTQGEGLYSCGLGHEVYLWDITTGEQKRSYTLSHRVDSAIVGIVDMSLSNNGRYIATAAFYDVIVTDIQTGEELLKFKPEGQHMRANSISFTPDSKNIAIGTDPGRLYIVDALSGDTVSNGKPTDIVKGGVKYSPDGKLLAVGAMNRQAEGSLLVFDAATVTEKYRMEIGGAVEDLAFSPGGNYLVSTSNNGYMYVWNMENGRLVRQYAYVSPFGEPVGERAVAISPDSSYIVSVLADDRVFLWNADWTSTTGVEERSPLHTATVVTDAAAHTLRLQFALAAPADVSIEIVDVQGRVFMAQSRMYNTGLQEQTIETSPLAQGAYYCRFRVGDRIIVRPFTIGR
jgi:WD40 repeat protein